MSTTTNRETARDEGSVDHRLARLLDTPLLARVVPHLAPETLHQLIQRRGLDACGELVTSATAAQLTALLDLDLWRHTPGRDDQFDVDRFGEWIEVLVDTGDSVAAQTVATLDEHTVIAGLSRFLRVFDPGTFEPTESSDDEAMDRHEMMHGETSRDVLECEVGGYLLRAARSDAWDAIVTLLLTLETEHNHYFHAVMQGCRGLSNSRPEIDGLHDLLMAPEQHLHDAAVERERRRSRHGYASAADARAFLQMARQPQPTPGASARVAINPIATAYFRAAEEEEHATEVSVPGDDIPAAVDAVIELLAEAARNGGQGVAPERPRALLEAAEKDISTTLPLLRRLMEFLRHHDETAYLTRGRELAFLANTLQAGASLQSRPFTPQEASDAAACICNLGLECWPAIPQVDCTNQFRSGRSVVATANTRANQRAARSGSPPYIPVDAFLVEHDLVAVFELGWSVLHRDVSLFVADHLMSTLAELQCDDADTSRGLGALQRRLATQREAGTPWLARDAADVLATLDMTAWNSVLGLLDECPILPATLTAVLERCTTPVSQTAFQFISTTAQIGDVRLFMRMLPNVLSPRASF